MISWSRPWQIAACLAAGTLIGCGNPKQPGSVILITVDTLRADHLSCYGYFRPTSPSMCGLAADGILFERAFATMATTLPSHASLMTSTIPLRHRVLGNYGHLGGSLTTSAGLQTAAQLLSKHGFATAAVVSSRPLGGHTGIAAGFEVFMDREGPWRRAEETTDQALEWLRSVDSGPVFLWVHYFDPHKYEPPESFPKFNSSPELVDFLEAKSFPEIDDDVLNRNNLYDTQIRYMDSHLARLIGEVKARGLYDDGTIVLTADHGEALGQHDWWYHGRIYNEQIHVPLILKLPDHLNRPGERRQEIASLIDVLPTLVGVLGLPLSEKDLAQLEGLDLLGGRPRRYVFSQRSTFVDKWDKADTWGAGLRYSLTSLKWKYIHDSVDEDSLFDMRSDPNETSNVIAEHPDVAARMLEVILRTIETYESAYADQESDVELPPEVVKQLESLGYIQ